MFERREVKTQQRTAMGKSTDQQGYGKEDSRAVRGVPTRNGIQEGR
jgi:hypothetical protein